MRPRMIECTEDWCRLVFVDYEKRVLLGLLFPACTLPIHVSICNKIPNYLISISSSKFSSALINHQTSVAAAKSAVDTLHSPPSRS